MHSKHWIEDEVLWEMASHKQPEEMDIERINIGFPRWRLSIPDIINTFKRIEEANLDYPIIIDEHHAIIDGYHRLVKAMMQNKKTIKVVILTRRELHERRNKH